MSAVTGPARPPLAFISYRRVDSAPAARLLSTDLRAVFGPGSVFIDTNDIRIGTDWPARIDERLQAASVLLAVIGPTWLRVSDEAGRRRIDKTSDWVRNEIAYALDNSLMLIPVIIAGASIPTRDALPRRVAGLTDKQVVRIGYECWDNDMNPLIQSLEASGFQRTGTAPVRLPRPHVRETALSEAELQRALHNLPGWKLDASFVPGREPVQRLELMKTFEFASFEDAIAFMAEAARYVSTVQHHPRWENTWRTVRIWLTTWDIGHKPSRRDVNLAEYLERLSANYREPIAE